MSLYTRLSLHLLREVFRNDHEISSGFKKFAAKKIRSLLT